MNLNKQVNTIDSREDFVSFVRSLLYNLKEEPDSWENCDIGSYLEAIAGWVEDMDGYYTNQGEPVPQQLNWKVLGQILLAAKFYE
jgi:hypothetical protein